VDESISLIQSRLKKLSEKKLEKIFRYDQMLGWIESNYY